MKKISTKEMLQANNSHCSELYLMRLKREIMHTDLQKCKNAIYHAFMVHPSTYKGKN